MSRTRLLLVSCYFPPTGGVQVQRALSLAKYLPDCGLDVHVLTTSNPSVPTLDTRLLAQIPPAVRVHRALTLEPPFYLRKKVWSRLKKPAAASGPAAPAARRGGLRSAVAGWTARALCPDPQVLWYPCAIRKAARIVREQRIDAVLVTAPPFSALLLGNELKRRFPHLALITDIRDEWLTYFVNQFAFSGDPYVKARAAEIERAAVELSDCVVPVTEATRREMQSRYPREFDEKFRVVPNGFDPEMFAGFQPRPHNTGKIVITYTGTIYAPSCPAVVLDAFDALPEGIRSRFELRFIGRMAEEYDRGVFSGRKCDVKVMGFVPQQQAFRYMEETDYLLLAWNDHLNVPGKLYEYLATGKPIVVAARPESDVAALMRRTGAGWCVDRNNPAALTALLTELAAPGGPPRPAVNRQEIARYERARLAAQYAGLIRELVERRACAGNAAAVTA